MNKLSLSQLSKNILEKIQLRVTLGGVECVCNSICGRRCVCSGEPIPTNKELFDNSDNLSDEEASENGDFTVA